MGHHHLRIFIPVTWTNRRVSRYPFLSDSAQVSRFPSRRPRIWWSWRTMKLWLSDGAWENNGEWNSMGIQENTCFFVLHSTIYVCVCVYIYIHVYKYLHIIIYVCCMLAICLFYVCQFCLVIKLQYDIL